jgi:hypothetical protein
VHDIAVARGATCAPSKKVARPSIGDIIAKAASDGGSSDALPMTPDEIGKAQADILREVRSRPNRSINGEVGFRERSPWTRP